MFDPAAINEHAFVYYRPLQRVKAFVEANYRNQITLKAVARIAGQGSGHFSSYFHHKVGITFCKWLRWVRIQQALSLMNSHDFSITEVAFATGFNDLRTFQRSFKMFLECTPREYQQTVQRDIGSGHVVPQLEMEKAFVR